MNMNLCLIEGNKQSMYSHSFSTPFFQQLNQLRSTPNHPHTSHHVTSQYSTTPHHTIVHHSTPPILHHPLFTSDFSMSIARLSMRDRACAFLESSPCSPPRAMESPRELNTPVSERRVWGRSKREGRSKKEGREGCRSEKKGSERGEEGGREVERGGGREGEREGGAE